MTISEVLEELRWVDRDVHETLRNYPIYCSVGEALTVNLLDSSNQILVEDAIQGSIQRACERRGWEIEQNYRTQETDQMAARAVVAAVKEATR